MCLDHIRWPLSDWVKLEHLDGWELDSWQDEPLLLIGIEKSIERQGCVSLRLSEMRKETKAVIVLTMETSPLGRTRERSSRQRAVAWRQHGVSVQKRAPQWIPAFMHPRP